MITKVAITGFKSYRAAELPLADLTVLIGANASGKSNLIEALQLLCWIAKGRRLGDLLSALKEKELAVRGTSSTLTFPETHEFGLTCWVADDSMQIDRLRLQLRLRVGDGTLQVSGEELQHLDEKTDFPLYRVEEAATQYGAEIQVAYNNFARGGRKPRIACIDQQAVFTQLATPARFAAEHRESQKKIPPAVEDLRRNLEAVLFLDPVPGRMRDYSFIIDRKLSGDGANVSSVLYDLCQREGGKARVLEFVRSLPEQDISDVDFIQTPRAEVMVKLVETFGGQPRPVEAALLSDGTLRVLAVASALLSVPEGSLVVIEEIDNGVHPSRAEALLNGIYKLAGERRLRVLLTTHNPALLDAIPPNAIPHVVYCYRDPSEGDSRLVRLQEIERYPELVAQGQVGQLLTRGILDRFVKKPLSIGEQTEKVQRFLASLNPAPERP